MAGPPTTPPRLAVIVTATLLGGMIAAVAVVGSHALEPRLSEVAGDALREAGLGGVDVRFDGREAFLTASGATPAQLVEAERVVEAVDGVRWATIVEADPSPAPSSPVPSSAPSPPSGPTPGEVDAINGTVIRFVADGVTLDVVARSQVALLAQLLQRYPDAAVTVTGHVAIPSGPERDAVTFSARRAQAVADALTAAGIDASRLTVVGAGSSQPAADNGTEAGAAANRRVTVLLVEGT